MESYEGIHAYIACVAQVLRLASSTAGKGASFSMRLRWQSAWSTSYLATLTYFYRNPELQAGEYSRMFGVDEEAQAWAAFYKGSTVIVNVDPRDLCCAKKLFE